MQREIAGLRGGLGRAEHEMQQRAAAGAALQSEIEGLRGALGQAAGEAQQTRRRRGGAAG
jgi:hypothetical protein